MTDTTDAFVDTRFSTEINNRMRVPDRIMVAGDSQTRSPTFMGVNGPTEPRMRSYSRETFDMKVPDRIIVAGGDRHIGAKSTPFEMQVENAVLPPTRDHVRVNTPPRSIRLDEHNFPGIQSDEEENGENGDDDEPLIRPQQQYDHVSRLNSGTPKRGAGKAVPRSTSVESESFNFGSRYASDPSMSMMETIHGGGSHNVNPWEEIQIVRRQIAKLNHRLMAVELENQQQQQREMILTVLVSCYFVGKFFMWLNRSH